jgi:UDP-N-acetyl-D-mannosaminuronic acid transferase (WecB/TagA/CpsF family)
MTQIKKYTVYSKEEFIRDFFEKKSGIFSFLNPYNSLYTIDNENIIYGVDSFYLAKFLINISNISFDNSNFAPIFFKFCEVNSLNILFIGASKIENINFINNLKNDYPNIICTGINGYEKTSVYDKELNDYKYDIVVIGVGSPLQEILSLQLYSLHNNIKFITCGGYIRQASEKLNYFPKIFIYFKIRFLYRFFKESHVFNRTLITYSKFLFYYIYGKIKFYRV